MRIGGLGLMYTLLYDDRMDVYRHEETKNEDGTTDVNIEEIPLYTNVPCRLSFEYRDLKNDGIRGTDAIRYMPKVFCRKEVDIRPGDFIVLTRYSDDGTISRVFRGHLGDSAWYSTHQEAILGIEEYA